MIGAHLITLAATAAVGLTGPPPASASASHWSRLRCTRTYISWYDEHFNPSRALTSAQVREVTAYVRTLERAHHCSIGG